MEIHTFTCSTNPGSASLNYVVKTHSQKNCVVSQSHPRFFPSSSSSFPPVFLSPALLHFALFSSSFCLSYPCPYSYTSFPPFLLTLPPLLLSFLPPFLPSLLPLSSFLTLLPIPRSFHSLPPSFTFLLTCPLLPPS